jgi:hypothetical protein
MRTPLINHLGLAFPAALLLLAVGSSQAMSTKIVSGDLKALKGEKLMRVEYVYPSDLRVGKMTEKDYVAEKTREYNEKSPGRGDQWAKAWISERESRFHPKFEELVNKMFQDKKQDLRISSTAENTKYTMVVTLTWLEPGWHAVVMARPAFLDATIGIVETANRDRTVAEIAVKKSPGRGVWDVGYASEQRLGESFAKCGKEVGNLIAKKGLK